jgi:hypothetical protein
VNPTPDPYPDEGFIAIFGYQHEDYFFEQPGFEGKSRSIMTIF